MAASIGSCCISGHISEGVPAGEVKKFGGVNTYFASPKNESKSAIVIATDVFGYDLPNTRLLADRLAKDTGYLVLVPDLFNGGGLPGYIMDVMVRDCFGVGNERKGVVGFFLGWLIAFWGLVTIFWPMLKFVVKHISWKKKIPILDSVFAQLHIHHGIRKIGLVGYCYGGNFSLHYGSKNDVVDAFAIAHSQIRVPKDIAPLTKPGLFICADNDHAFPKKAREQAEAYLTKKNPQDYIFKFYPGTYHGFAIRGDSRVKSIEQAKEDALQQTVQFFLPRLASSD